MKFIRKNILYIPLILIELYLVFTLILFKFGLSNWIIENESIFWFFIIMYHIMFIIGYIFSIKKINVVHETKEKKGQFAFTTFIWIVLFICLICSLIEYRNTTFASSYIPYELPENFINGLINPGQQYYSKFILANSFNPNKLVTIISALFSFVYVSMIPIFIFNWEKISFWQKIFFYFLVFFKISFFVSIGTNKGIFDTLFVFGGCLLIDLLIQLNLNNLHEYFKKYSLLAFTFFLFIFSFIYFTFNINSRLNPVTNINEQNNPEVIVSNENLNSNNNANFELEEENEVTSNDTNSSGNEIETIENDSFLYKMVEHVSNYLTQGYYGMSLSVDEEFTSTYGIGNSQFLMSNFKSIFGIDVSDRTYQHKITEEWHESQHWHSFYSYIANDVSFYGVILVMFIIGIYFGLVWKDVIENNSLIGKLLLPLFLIMFIYMPANNQMLTNMATFCAFFELTFIWVYMYIRNRRRKNE